MNKMFLIFNLIILIPAPAMACYGDYCSTQLGIIYDYPWEIINKIAKPYPTSVISVFDDAYKSKNIPPTTNKNGNYNFSYKICQNQGICQTINSPINNNQ